MSKHTPGPWLYRGKSDSVHEQCETHPYGRQIFRFVEDEAPSDADLSLILAAPELYAALLRMLRTHLPDAVGEMANADERAEARWLATDALARARGSV